MAKRKRIQAEGCKNCKLILGQGQIQKFFVQKIASRSSTTTITCLTKCKT
uniref:Uncharacterized protein n=1 Tax=Meloidogyne enterolobii TaxID=390850 RepID=A0A6V7XAG3_MELEN|nr:unnamed protein product [Meloidogyne enterolobii]